MPAGRLLELHTPWAAGQVCIKDRPVADAAQYALP